jgi:hypothetical protein
MLEELILQIQVFNPFQPIGDFEDIFTAVFRLHIEAAISLAGQRTNNGRLSAIAARDKRCRLFGRYIRLLFNPALFDFCHRMTL